MTAPSVAEPIIDPQLPIVDAHHHLWFLPKATLTAMEHANNSLSRALVPMFRCHARYLFDEFIADATSGHNVRASVFVEARTMYRSDGPDTLKSVGEVEFANGAAAMGASGLFGATKACAGIVGCVDLSVGEAAEDVLQAHVQSGAGRYRGIRWSAMHDDDSTLMGGGGKPRLLYEPTFRKGFALLRRFGLSFDALLLEPQLPDLVDLARTFPDTQIVLNHVGVPVGIGRYAGQRAERFSLWLDSIRSLSRCENVVVKLGGLGIPICGFVSEGAPPRSSAQLADAWRPYLEACIETFGAERCMFESNFPVDSAAGTYATIWNAFKRITANASPAEKRALFSGTAARVYRLDA